MKLEVLQTRRPNEPKADTAGAPGDCARMAHPAMSEPQRGCGKVDGKEYIYIYRRRWL